MRLAVISDTHLSGPDERFCALYEGAFSRPPMSCCTAATWWAPLFITTCCVRGNCDHFILDHDVPQTLSRTLALPGGEITFGMAHGWGERSTVWLRVAELFPKCDLVCFGHTHRRHFAEHNGACILNPGSLAEGSFALLDIADDGAMGCTFVDL
jgi:Predicted phosphoesterase